MPTVLRNEGFRLYFWSREPEWSRRMCMWTKPAPRPRYSWNRSRWRAPPAIRRDEQGAIMRLIRAHQADLLDAWHEFFRPG